MGFVKFIKKTLSNRKKLKSAYQSYSAKATPTKTLPSDDPNYDYTIRVALIWFNFKSKRKAIQVLSSTGGVALHEINSGGDFSKKGPYYIPSRHNGTNWIPYGTYALVRTLKGQKSNGFKLNLPHQVGIVNEIGIEVLEWDTAKRPPLSFESFARMNQN